jgi:hypothetical protein
MSTVSAPLLSPQKEVFTSHLLKAMSEAAAVAILS